MVHAAAVKIIDRLKAPQDYQEKFMPRELKHWPKLRHPNLIALNDWFQVPHRIVSSCIHVVCTQWHLNDFESEGTVSRAPVEATGPWTRDQCVARTVCLFTPPANAVFGDRGKCVRTTCPRWNWTVQRLGLNLRSSSRKSNAVTTAPLIESRVLASRDDLKLRRSGLRRLRIRVPAVFECRQCSSASSVRENVCNDYKKRKMACFLDFE